MSINIPLEIQIEVIKKLPPKSLIQFRSVSKSWKSLIDNPRFMSHYIGQIQHLLVTYKDSNFDQNYVTIADNNSFPQQNSTPTIPQLVNWLKYYHTVGCSHGLLCLYSDLLEGNDGPLSRMGMVVLWNPSIRKAVGVVVPNVENGIKYATVVGFGVCGDSNDPKVVKITYVRIDRESRESVTCIPHQVEVFTLSKGVWRSLCSNLPRMSVKFFDTQVVVDRFHYWLGKDRVVVDGGFRECNLVVSFDMTSNEFGEINLPDSLAQQASKNVSMSELRGSLVVVERVVEVNHPVSVVWMMVDGVRKSFTKLLTVNVNTPNDAIVVGFRKSGEPLVEIEEDDGNYSLVVYEPYSKRVDNLGIGELEPSSFRVFSYVETLILHDQPNLTVYSENKILKFGEDLFHEQFQLPF